MTSPEQFARRLAEEAAAADDPTGWFERVYAAAEAGETEVPWDHGVPNRLLVQWADDRDLRGAGRRAIVVGCGLGEDAELIADRGFDTTAFDISPTAIRAARRRYPGSAVRYVTADLLNLPEDWIESYDLVVESLTLQALTGQPRRSATASLGRLVGPGGTLYATARAREPDEPDDGPPYALTRAEIDELAAPGLRPVRIEDLREAEPLPGRHWRVEFVRPAASR
jgi:SAM-dependent methyltransferase